MAKTRKEQEDFAKFIRAYISHGLSEDEDQFHMKFGFTLKP